MIHQIVLIAKLDNISNKLFAGDSSKRVFEDGIDIARRAALGVCLLFLLDLCGWALLYMLYLPRSGVSDFIFLHTGRMYCVR